MIHLDWHEWIPKISAVLMMGLDIEDVVYCSSIYLGKAAGDKCVLHMLTAWNGLVFPR